MSNIQWTDETWNPVVGCTKVSSGCANCYAEVMSNRLAGMARADVAAGKEPGRKAHHLAVINGAGRFNGTVRTVPEVLGEPLRWRTGGARRVFVNSMSDLFHEGVEFEYIAAVHGIMLWCPGVEFQVLTKRPERALKFQRWLVAHADAHSTTIAGALLHYAQKFCRDPKDLRECHPRLKRDLDEKLRTLWPLPNVWLGASVEGPKVLWRVEALLRCDAAVRFLSVEPLLDDLGGDLPLHAECPLHPGAAVHGLRGDTGEPFSWYCYECGGDALPLPSIDWVIFGGESGAGARPCDAAWIRRPLALCAAAGVPAFVKQLGAASFDSAGEAFCTFASHGQWVHKAGSWLGGVSGGGQRHKPRERVACVDARGRLCAVGADFMRADADGAYPVRAFKFTELRDAKGGDVNEWPAELRVREWPKGAKG